MDEKLRRIWMLVATGVVAVLALVAAWPSQGAATEKSPLYLVRDRGQGVPHPPPVRVLAVADGPRLVTHLSGDGEDVARLEVIDDAGRVVVLSASGRADVTGEMVDPEAVQVWLQNRFSAARRSLDWPSGPNGRPAPCRNERERAQELLNLPQSDRKLTLAETFAEAEGRLAAMHEAENEIPMGCFPPGSPIYHHRDGYLHNLWHRLRGTS
jgi:hypothetical protein